MNVAAAAAAQTQDQKESVTAQSSEPKPFLDGTPGLGSSACPARILWAARVA